MFPDSQMARKFSCGERKAGVRVYGLAEHFTVMLKQQVNGLERV